MPTRTRKGEDLRCEAGSGNHYDRVERGVVHIARNDDGGPHLSHFRRMGITQVHPDDGAAFHDADLAGASASGADAHSANAACSSGWVTNNA